MWDTSGMATRRNRSGKIWYVTPWPNQSGAGEGAYTVSCQRWAFSGASCTPFLPYHTHRPSTSVSRKQYQHSSPSAGAVYSPAKPFSVGGRAHTSSAPANSRCTSSSQP